MTDPSALVAIMIAVVSIVTFLGARRFLDRDRARLERRLATLQPDTVGATVPAGPPNLAERVDRSFEDMVHRTGLGLTTGQTVGILALTGVAAAAGLYFAREEEWAGALGLVLGLSLPLILLWVLKGRRTRLLQGQLPDAYFFLARSLRAGLSLEQALARAGEQLAEPLAAEFRRCSAQIQLGLHPQKALEHMASRLRLTDFDVFVSTVSLYYQSGGNLALLLDRLAASTRDRVQFIGYFRAATALGRIAGIVLGSAVPLLILAYAILQPEHMGELFRSTAGWQLLGTATILEIIGIIWFVYLLRIDY